MPGNRPCGAGSAVAARLAKQEIICPFRREAMPEPIPMRINREVIEMPPMALVMFAKQGLQIRDAITEFRRLAHEMRSRLGQIRYRRDNPRVVNCIAIPIEQE